jgi:membrane protease YdiL (CAAX protease family)
MKEYFSSLLHVIPFILALAGIAVAVKRERVTKEELGLQRPRSLLSTALWIIGFMLFAVLVELTLYYNGLLQVNAWEIPKGVMILRIVGIMLLAPITEELLLRGLLLSKLKSRNINTILAVCTQALLFVLLHSFAYEGTLQSKIGIAQVFIDGCLFGFARLQTRSIFTSIGMHMCGNLIAVLERILG